MSEPVLLHLITAGSLVFYKVVVLVIGFLFAFLGYKLFIRGITGGFKLSAEYKGIKADLISASPGIFFILTGTIIISIVIYKGLTLEQVTTNAYSSSESKESAMAQPPTMKIPKTPPPPDVGTSNGE